MNHQNSENVPSQLPPAHIFLVFLRLGITAFGGPAMVAYIREAVVVKRGWITETSFEDGVALCQSIPGATAMQAAAYSGFRVGGLRGAMAAYVGFGLPAVLLMIALSAVYAKAQDFQMAASIFAGLHLIVVAIMANATLNFGRTSLKSVHDVVLAAAVAAFLGLGGNPLLAIVVAAGSSLLLYRHVIPAPANAFEQRIDCPARTQTNRLPIFVAGMALILISALAFLHLVDRTLFHLAAIMLRIDVFAFGGGFASIPLMFHEIVNVRQWLDGKTFMDGIALGQVTPGPIVITATFVGYQVGGLLGAVVATIGIFTPSFFVLVLSAPHLERLKRSSLCRRALRGALVCFAGLLFAVTIRFGFAVQWSAPSAVLAVLVLIALRLKVDMLWVVLAGALISAIVL